MSFLGFFSTTTLGATVWHTASKMYYRIDFGADETHFALAKDGWRIALSRYLPKGEKKRDAPPVVLCHGLAANRYTWDLGPEQSLARWLADRGYDVWSLELRGHGLSDHGGWRTGRSLSWSVDEYLLNDVPAALQLVRAKTGAKEVDWIGHSMGGLLGYSLLQTPAAESVRTAVILGSSLNYSGTDSDFRYWQKYLSWARKRISGLPLGHLVRLSAPLALRFENPFDQFSVWPANTQGELYRRLLANGFHWLPLQVLEQLESAIEPEGFRSADGKTNYASGVASISKPVLVIGGDRDRQCPEVALRKTAELLPAASTRILVLKDQGHFDLLIGKRCEAEVFPAIETWLASPQGAA